MRDYNSRPHYQEMDLVTSSINLGVVWKDDECFALYHFSNCIQEMDVEKLHFCKLVNLASKFGCLSEILHLDQITLKHENIASTCGRNMIGCWVQFHFISFSKKDLYILKEFSNALMTGLQTRKPYSHLKGNLNSCEL